ncbi:hypothetical protein J3L18_07035 [Mucilaginibacter gossypii]|uniref:hypothetical protein n=1 Tax=Mucilaginibacter gossypii TaxID=551996 RepID=UPI000DCB4493|nr:MULTISPECIES: hypothetical protein [Mucilaginibacter]QTE38814.1 hypothetical protein J3L18_07035 [Mucilaginibacter gossypii]RAV55110.1 hypothetical protein DIU36_18065 [Mucilaginibacter rubeus]
MKYLLLFSFFLCTAICSCSFQAEKKKAKQSGVLLFCLKDNDTIYVKITNNTDSIIYVPPKYTPDFTNNDDTLHFETVNKAKYSITRYYRYKNVLPFEFHTTREIKGISADSVEEHRSPVTFYNQFRVQPMHDIKPGASYIEKIEFNVPKYVNVLQVVYYSRPFLNSYQKYILYSYKDFMAFDSLYASYVNTSILIRYR